MSTIRIILLTVVSLWLNSCALDDCFNKSVYISSFEKFVTEVNNNYKDYTKADWEKAQLRFDKFTGECYEKFEKDLTPAEERKIFNQSLKYSFYKFSSHLPIDLNSDEAQKFSEDIEKLIDKEKDLNKVIEKIKANKDFKKAGEDLKRGLEHFGKGMEKLGKELENAFKENKDKR